MDNHYYYGALRKVLIQFANIFNNIKIAKYDHQGNITKYIRVPVKFGPKDTAFQSTWDCKRAKAFPMMAIQLFAITHDQLRIANKTQVLTVSKDLTSGNSDVFLNPVPYNIDFQVGIIANYMIEMDQILEQILSYFNPHLFIRIKIPELGDQHFDVKVVFSSSTPDTETAFTETTYRVVGWTLYFTAYTYLFTPATQAGITKKIITSYYPSQEAFDDRSMTTMFTSAAPGNFESEVDFLKAIGYSDTSVEAEETFYSIEDHVGEMMSPSASPVPPPPSAAPPPILDTYWPIPGVTKPQHIWPFAQTQGYGDYGSVGGLNLVPAGDGNTFNSGGLVLDGNGYATTTATSADINDLGDTWSVLIEYDATIPGTLDVPAVLAAVSDGIAPSASSYEFSVPATGARATFLSDGTEWSEMSYGPNDAEFQPSQLVWVMENGECTLYNGGHVDRVESMAVPQSSNLFLTIGAVSGGKYPIVGSIKRVGILKGKAWSSDDVAAIYASLGEDILWMT